MYCLIIRTSSCLLVKSAFRSSVLASGCPRIPPLAHYQCRGLHGTCSGSFQPAEVCGGKLCSCIGTLYHCETGMGIWIRLHSFVKGFVNLRIVIVLAQHMGYNTPVTEIQNSAQIESVHLNTFIPFEFCHIGELFLVWPLRMELVAQQVLRKILRALGSSGTASIVVLYSGTYIFGPAEAQHPFIVDMDVIVMPQIVIKPPVAFVRAF